MEKGVEREKNLSLADYQNDGYFTRHQWESYFFQVSSVRNLVRCGGNILEIGCGGGIVRSILELIGYSVETIDVNENLNPTYVKDISSVAFSMDKKYDLVLCAEVLEHISLDSLDTCLSNIKGMSNKYVILTLPNCISAKFEMEVSINRHKKGLSFGTKINEIAPMHYWELNYNRECSVLSIREKISNYYKIINEGKLRDNNYHYYYICEI